MEIKLGIRGTLKLNSISTADTAPSRAVMVILRTLIRLAVFVLVFIAISFPRGVPITGSLGKKNARRYVPAGAYSLSRLMREGCRCFFHPDYNRRLRNFTGSAPEARAGFTAGGDFHSAPKHQFLMRNLVDALISSRSRPAPRSSRSRPGPGRTPAPGRSSGTSFPLRRAFPHRHTGCCRR